MRASIRAAAAAEEVKKRSFLWLEGGGRRRYLNLNMSNGYWRPNGNELHKF